jgi:hypothetical protein
VCSGEYDVRVCRSLVSCPCVCVCVCVSDTMCVSIREGKAKES